MLVVETPRGPFRLVEVYYAQRPEDVKAVRDSVTLKRIVYIRQALILLDSGRFAGWYRPTTTILLNLEHDLDKLFTEASVPFRK